MKKRAYLMLGLALLLAAATVLAPIIIHLVARRESSGALFPSLFLLQRIPPQRLQRRQIQHPLLLLIRCLLLAVLAMVFAGPWCSFTNTLVEVEQQTVILVDRSYSMGGGDKWSKVQEAALERTVREKRGSPMNSSYGKSRANSSHSTMPRL